MKMTWSRKNRNQPRQSGTQILEFALVLPFLVLLAMGIIEGGWFIRIHQVVSNAAREGARVATAPNNNQFTDAGTHHNVLGEKAACDYLNQNKNVFPGWTGGSCAETFSISVEDVQPGDPDQITVTDPDGATVVLSSTRAVVEYQYEMRYLPLAAFFSWSDSPLVLRGRAQFRNLY
ncbi:MAG TPA: TadE/TadG family type IV pilus assembly protein [Terriglobales bacterium]|nr:TadE/TadG family type IV pilus assembly protein [Terriglobales bacterium]